MNKTISFNYKELEKFIEEINTKLQERFRFYLINNKLALYDTIYNSEKTINGKIIITEKINKEIIDKELIKHITDNYLFINMLRVKRNMTNRQLKLLDNINNNLENFYLNLSFFKEYNLKVKLNHLKYEFKNNLKEENNTIRIKNLFNKINNLSEELYNKML